MIVQQAAHAKFRPPSAAARWLSCPGSAYITYMYPNDESDKSLKGTLAHSLLENGIIFGLKPDTADPDMDMNIMEALAWVKAKKAEYGKDCQVFAEQQLDTPHTGEFGTADIIFVSPEVLHVVDYKDGYVPVEIKMNPQLNTYLLSAVAKWGTRKRYFITVYQPNYNHVDGPWRTYEVTQDQLDWFEQELAGAVRAPEDTFKAGTHCKKTYCPHRGACVTFMAWARTDASKAWFPSEINALDDTQLAQALDHADTLQGTRDELRKEGMRRILQMDRRIEGYKIVRSRTQREFKGDQGRAAAYEALIAMGYAPEDLVERTPIDIPGIERTIYKQDPLSVAGVERMVKQKYKNFGRGEWKKVWDTYIQPHVLDFSGSLTLERAIDGRPSHTRGSEFGSLIPAQPQPQQVEQVGQVIII